MSAHVAAPRCFRTSTNFLTSPLGTLHDLRRTFATNLAQLGVAPHVIERLLNHVTGQISGVAAIYNRAKYFDEMAQAMQQWEARLAEILND
jgi:integrase